MMPCELSWPRTMRRHEKRKKESWQKNARTSAPAAASPAAAIAPLRLVRSTLAPNKRTNVKHVIGVVSGKGGVGKSLVTSLLASEMNKRGHKVAILDADITGPSIPKSFGVDSAPDRRRRRHQPGEVTPAASRSCP